MRCGLAAVLLLLLAACGKEPESPAAPTPPKPWGPKPKEGTANLRLILRVYGKPLDGSGKSDGKFRLTLMPGAGGSLVMKEFLPDAEGRYICEEIEPGRYTVEVTSARREYPDWKQANVELASDTSPLLRVDLK